MMNYTCNVCSEKCILIFNDDIIDIPTDCPYKTYFKERDIDEKKPIWKQGKD